MEVLVDTSIWINYFRGGNNSKDLDSLIDENLIVTNDIILAELIPYLKIKKQTKVVKLLHEVNLIPLDICWKEIIEFQEIRGQVACIIILSILYNLFIK